MADDPKDEKAGAVGGGALVPPPPSGDSPKPHGDKMEKAVREAADAPPKDRG